MNIDYWPTMSKYLQQKHGTSSISASNHRNIIERITWIEILVGCKNEWMKERASQQKHPIIHIY